MILSRGSYALSLVFCAHYILLVANIVSEVIQI
jgi:hypothetical protein